MSFAPLPELNATEPAPAVPVMEIAPLPWLTMSALSNSATPSLLPPLPLALPVPLTVMTPLPVASIFEFCWSFTP